MKQSEIDNHKGKNHDYSVIIWEDFKNNELKNLVRKTAVKNNISLKNYKLEQLLEDCTGYLEEKFIEINLENMKYKEDYGRYRAIITGSLRIQIKSFFRDERTNNKKRKILLTTYAKQLPKERQEMIHIDKTLDWSEFDFTGLSKRDLQIVCFIYLGGKSNEWIAEKLNITVNNIYQIHHRIINKLRNTTNENLYLASERIK